MSDPNAPSDNGSGGGGSSTDDEAPPQQGSTRIKLVVTVIVVVAVVLGAGAAVFFSAREVFDKTADEKIGEELETIQEELGIANKQNRHHRHGPPDSRHPQRPNEVNHPKKPGQCPPSHGFGITVHECRNDFECGGSMKCCAVGRGAGQMCREPVAVNDVPEKPGQCPPSDGFGITVHECSNDFECDGSMKCCAVGGGAGQTCQEPDFMGQVSPTPSPVQSGHTTTLEDCPKWDDVWVYTSAVCNASLTVAKYFHYNKCSFYKDFVKCMSFIMRTMNYHCSEQDLQKMAEANHRDLYARKPGTLDTYPNFDASAWDSFRASSDYGCGGPCSYNWESAFYGRDANSWGGSSSSYYGGSDWYSPGSSGNYGHGWSDWYNRGPSKYYGSSWLYSRSSGLHDGSYWPSSSSSDYFGSGWSDWYSSGLNRYYGSDSSSWLYSSSSDYYGGSYWPYSSSSDYYSSSWSDWYNRDPSKYYGSSSSSGYYGESYWPYSSSSDYYSSSWSDWYNRDPSKYYGSSSSSGYYDGSYWRYSSSSDYYSSSWSDWYNRDPSKYYGSSSSSGYYDGSYWPYSSSSDYYSSSWSDWYNRDPSKYYGSSSSSGYYGESYWPYSSSSDYYSSSWSDWYNRDPSKYYGSSSSSGYYGESYWPYSSSSDYYSSSWSDWYNRDPSKYYGSSSSSGYYGESYWPYSSSSDYYSSSWSDWYNRDPSKYYGSSSSSGYYDGSYWRYSSSSDYYSSSWSDWYNRDPSKYYGSSSSSGYYHGSYWRYSSSSDYYSSSWSDWYNRDPSKYYGSSSSSGYYDGSYWRYSSSSDYYSSSWSDWYNRDPSKYYGFSSSSGYYGGSYWPYSSSSDYYSSSWSDWYSRGVSKYYGSDGSSWPYSSSSGYYGGSYWPSSSSSDHYGSGWSGWGYSRSSRYHGNDRDGWRNSDLSGSSDYHGYGSHQWGSGSSSDYGWGIYPSYSDSMYGAASGYQDHYPDYPALIRHFGDQPRSMPDICKNYVALSLVDMMMTDPCSNPDAYLYVLKYHCRDTSSHATSMTLPHGRRRRRVNSGFHYATTTSSSMSSSIDSSKACLVLFQKAQCIRDHLKRAQLTCSSSAIFDTIENHKHSILTAEVDQCTNFRDKLRTDGCYQAIVGEKATCLHKLHNTENKEKACSMFKAAVKCIKESYPYQCGRKRASQALRQWLSAAGVKRELSSSLGIDLNCDSLQLFFECSSTKVALTPDRAVLMQIQGKWTRVCADGWNDSDAHVVCRSMGFNVGYALERYDDSAYFGDHRSRVESRTLNMSCTGHETSPFHCSYMKGNNCPSGLIAGAICYKSAPVYEIVSDKQNSPYGYVRRTADGRSAFVTAHWMEKRAADLFCKAGGYPDGGILFTRSLPTNIDMGSFHWSIDSLSCESTDTAIEVCASRSKWRYENVRVAHERYHGSMGYTTSDYSTLVKVFCFTGGVRLHNNLLNSTGIPQVLDTSTKSISSSENQYMGICRQGFTNFTASLFCRALSLGFQSGQAVGYQPFTYMTNASPYVKFTCRGHETKLSECQNQTMWYWVGEPGFAVVKCTPPLVSETVPEMSVKLDYDNRTVLVYKNHQWGHIGSVHWTNTEAEQVCKALNFDTGTAEVQYVEKTFYPYLINNVSCQGADSWRECRYQDVVGDVSSDLRPAKAFCYNQGNVPVFSLYNGKDNYPHYGWVHVSSEGTRGRLCSYLYPELYGVLCRQLGFVDGEEYRRKLPDEEMNSEPFWVTSFTDCDKDSHDLESCRNQPWHKGQELEYDMNGRARVIPRCSYPPIKAFCYGQAARVHSGYFNTSGVLKMAYHQTYQHVCATRSTYTQEAANVICHNLTRSRTSSALRVRKNVFKFTAKPTMHVNFSCDGTEQDLNRCMTITRTNDHSNGCRYDENMVAVVCYEGKRPADGITGWKIGVQDSVLVKRFGLWGHVCPLNWTDNEAAAVCRMLGHYSGAAILTEASGTRLAQWVDTMSCPAGASHVSQCSITMRNYTVPIGPDYSPCYARRAKCFEKWEVPTMFFVDNAALSSARPQGRLAVTYNGTTGYFCSPYTSEETHSILCRLMGYPRGGEALNTNTTSLPEPNTYSKAWQGLLSCGVWDRNVHYVTCLRDWNLHDMRDGQDGWHGGDPSTNGLSWCGQHVPAVSCFDSGDYRLIPTPYNKSQGLLVVWNQGKKRWETVCRSGFSDKEANAACRQLGFSEGGQVINEHDSSLNTYSRRETRFQCSGMAGEKLSSCSTSTESCWNNSPVWVGCGGTS